MVAAQGEYETALASVLVDLGAEGTIDCADGAGPLHVAVVRVVRVEVVVVGVDLAVIGDIVVEIIFELGDEAGFDEGVRSSIDACFGLYQCQSKENQSHFVPQSEFAIIEFAMRRCVFNILTGE